MNIKRIEQNYLTVKMASSNKMILLDIPDEILLEIFNNLSDHTLTQVVHVCKRLKAIAGTSFANRYSSASADTFYSLKIFGDNCTDERKQYQKVFQHFGGSMKAITVDFNWDVVVRNHWLPLLIQRYCKSMMKVKIANSRGMNLQGFVRTLPNLAELSLERIQFSDLEWTQYSYPKLVNFSVCSCKIVQEALHVFITRNPQLEILSLRSVQQHDNGIIHLICDKLHNLKKLKLMDEDTINLTKTVSLHPMDCLISLTIRVDESSFIPYLTVIQGLKKVEELNVCSWRTHKLRAGDVDLLSSFKTLKTLELQDAYELPADLLKIIISRLTNLVSFSLGDAQNLFQTTDDLLGVVFVCRNLSFLELYMCTVEPILVYDLCTRFVDIMETNECNLKMELSFSEFDTTVFTRHEVCREDYSNENMKRHQMLYWKGYDAIDSQKINFLDLNNEVLTKVFKLLDGNAISSLFQTCKKLQQLVIEHIAENEPFRCYVNPKKFTNENVFIVLQNYIRRIVIDLTDNIHTYDDDDEGTKSKAVLTKFVECVHQHCGNSLTELKVKGDVQIRSILSWPNLKKLELPSIDIEKLQLFHCTQLSHLNIRYFSGDSTNVNWTNGFPNLTSLEFGRYSESVGLFLWYLSDKVCHQIKNLHIEGPFKERGRWLKLTSVIARFGHLVALHIQVNGPDKSKFKILFENYSMAVELMIRGGTFDYLDYERIFADLFRTIQQKYEQVNVTSLKFETYVESVNTLLCGLSERVRDTVEKVHIAGSFKTKEHRMWLPLTNNIARFGHLVTLHLDVGGIEQSNFKFLFESCSMLVELTICVGGHFMIFCETGFCDLIRTIKRNCKQLEYFQLIDKTTEFFDIDLAWIRSMFPKVRFNCIERKINDL